MQKQKYILHISSRNCSKTQASSMVKFIIFFLKFTFLLVKPLALLEWNLVSLLRFVLLPPKLFWNLYAHCWQSGAVDQPSSYRGQEAWSCYSFPHCLPPHRWDFTGAVWLIVVQPAVTPQSCWPFSCGYKPGQRCSTFTSMGYGF